MTDTLEDIETLRQWYLETIGYDPFAELGAWSVQDVRAIKAEYLAERAALG